MKEYKIILFKAPTCGPCKMFQPQIEKAVELYNLENKEKQIIFELCDVSTDDGLAFANKYGIESSGEAILVDVCDIETPLIIWHRPQASDDILNSISARINI